jgi:hypothetical protein
MGGGDFTVQCDYSDRHKSKEPLKTANNF